MFLGCFKFSYFVSTEKFDLQQLATPHAQLPTTILELLSNEYLGNMASTQLTLRNDTAAVYVLLLDQIEKKKKRF